MLRASRIPFAVVAVVLWGCDAGSDGASNDEPVETTDASDSDTPTVNPVETPAAMTTVVPAVPSTSAEPTLPLSPTATASGPGGNSGLGGNSGAGGSSGATSGGAPSTSGGGGAAAVAGSGGVAGGAGASGSGGNPSPPEFGIEARPVNQTCVPPPARDQAALLLSETGCVDPSDPKLPAATLLPYDVASPLWSDGAAKARYLALPDGGVISVKDCVAAPGQCDPADPAYTPIGDGEWDVPDGSVLVKTFRLGERLVETRLLVRRDEFNWWGYSYEWREDQSDADLLASNSDGYLREITTAAGTQEWHFPSRTHCLQCHTDSAGRVLGLETSQQNTLFTYPNGIVANQLETLARVDLFADADGPPPRDAYPGPADDAVSVELRARSYLHANCANCHRPGGETADIDLRFDTPFADMGICGVTPTKGDLDVAGALLIAPGDATLSVVSLRMHTLDTEVRMPRIGTRVVDEAGVAVVDEWINGLGPCPE